MRDGGGDGEGDGCPVVVDGGDGGVVCGRQKMKIKVSLGTGIVLLLGCHQFPLANPLAAGLTTLLEHHASQQTQLTQQPNEL